MYYESYLYHHGIKGQKWGKQNGPPYPLSRKEKKYVKQYNKQSKKVQKAGNKEVQKLSNYSYVSAQNTYSIIKKSYRRELDRAVKKLNKELDSLDKIENSASKKLGEDFVKSYLRKEKSR